METGVVGLSLFLLIFVILGTISYRFLSRNKSWFYQWLVIGLVSSLSASLAQNVASVNLRWMSSTFIFWMLVSFLVVAFRLGTSKPTHFEGLFRESRSLRQANQLFPQLSWKTVVHGCIGMVFAGAVYGFYYLLQSDFALKSTNAMIRFAESRRMSWDRASDEGLRSVGYNPYNLSARYKLGYINLKRPNYNEASSHYDKLTDIAPNYAQIHNNVALIHKNFNRPYRSLLHFEWATTLEDNLRNHMNMMRRYSRKGLQKRAILHSFSIPRIAMENQRNIAHRNTVWLSEGMFKHNWRFLKTDRKFKSLHEKFVSGLTFMRNRIRSIHPTFSDFVQMKSIMAAPDSRQTVRSVLSPKEKKEMIPPMNFLALSVQLRGMEGKKIDLLRQQYTRYLSKWLNENRDSDPIYRLVAANLYDQLGQKETARMAVKGYVSKWKQQPFLGTVLQDILE